MIFIVLEFGENWKFGLVEQILAEILWRTGNLNRKGFGENRKGFGEASGKVQVCPTYNEIVLSILPVCTSWHLMFH